MTFLLYNDLQALKHIAEIWFGSVGPINKIRGERGKKIGVDLFYLGGDKNFFLWNGKFILGVSNFCESPTSTTTSVED